MGLSASNWDYSDRWQWPGLGTGIILSENIFYGNFRSDLYEKPNEWQNLSQASLGISEKSEHGCGAFIQRLVWSSFENIMY